MELSSQWVINLANNVTKNQKYVYFSCHMLSTQRETHLATSDTATGSVLIEFPARRYSWGESSFLPQNPKYTPISVDSTNIKMKRHESTQPNRSPEKYPVVSIVKFIVMLQNCHES